MARLALLFFSSSALAHPGHGALEIHWHIEDLALMALFIAAVAGLVYVLKKKSRQ